MSYNILHVIKDLFTGQLSLVDTELSTKRYEICKSCEMRNTTLNICTVCGCSIPLKVKLKKAECPAGNW